LKSTSSYGIALHWVVKRSVISHAVNEDTSDLSGECFGTHRLLMFIIIIIYLTAIGF
jgi:hypothetical protein